MKKFAAVICALCIAYLSIGASINAVDLAENTHLQNPVSVCYDGVSVYVADSNDDSGFVYVFSPDGLNSVNFDAAIIKIRVSEGKLYAMSKDIMSIYDLQQETFLNIPATEIKDFEIDENKLYALFPDCIREITVANLQTADLNEQGRKTTVNSDTSKIAIDGEDIYYLTENEITLLEGRYTHDLGIYLGNEKATDITFGCHMLFKFNGNALEFGTAQRTDDETVNYNKLGGKEFDFAVADVFAYGEKVYAINADKLTVISYDLIDNEIIADGTVYGSNVKDYSTAYGPIDGFEKIEICKTTEKTFLYAAANGNDMQQWYGYLEKDTLVMKLNSCDGFAYILYRNADGIDGFGFIDQNDLIKVPHSAAHQIKVTITSNENIFSLPLYKDEMKIKNENGEEIKLANTQEITVLAEINEFDGGIWVFAEVDGIRGFMLKDRLKNPPVVYPTYEVFVANPAIGNSLVVYKDVSLNEEIAKLKSGEQIKVFETYGNLSKILIEIDGQNVYGWVESSFLIREGGLTDTVAFGLAIGIIILLTAGFVVVWKIVKNKK